MNAPFNHDQLSNDLASMGGLADKWRGECIQQFAELEQIVEGLLLELARAPKHGK